MATTSQHTSNNIRFRLGFPSPTQILMWEEWEVKGGQTERFHVIDGQVVVWRRNGWRNIDATHPTATWSKMYFRPQLGLEPQPWSVAPPDFIAATIKAAKQAGKALEAVALWESIGLPASSMLDRAEAWALYKEVRLSRKAA